MLAGLGWSRLSYAHTSHLYTGLEDVTSSLLTSADQFVQAMDYVGRQHLILTDQCAKSTDDIERPHLISTDQWPHATHDAIGHRLTYAHRFVKVALDSGCPRLTSIDYCTYSKGREGRPHQTSNDCSGRPKAMKEGHARRHWPLSVGQTRCKQAMRYANWP